MLLTASVVTHADAQTICGGWVLSPETSPPGVGPTVVTRGLAFDRDGPGPQPEAFYLGGRLGVAGSDRARGLGKWDGEKWSSVDQGVRYEDRDGEVYALGAFGGSLIVGGFFTSAGHASASNIARWNGVDWEPLGEGLDWSVFAVGAYRGELIAGGAFGLQAAGSPRGVARWDGQAWGPLGLGVDNWVRDMTVYEGELIVCGDFSTAGGLPAVGIAAWNGTSWRVLGTGLNGSARFLAVHRGKLYVSGLFSKAGSVEADRIAAWDGTEWSALRGSASGVRGGGPIASFGDDLLLNATYAERYPDIGSPVYHNVALWDGTEWRGPGSRTPIVGQLVGEFRGEAVLNGSYLQEFYGTSGPVTWNGSRVLPLVSGLSDRVQQVQAFGSELVVSGSFDYAGQQRVDSLVRWDGARWIGFPPIAAEVVGNAGTMGLYNGRLVVSRRVGSADGSRMHAIVTWDGERWSELGGFLDGGADAFAEHDGTLYAAGSFSLDPASSTSRGVIAWNGRSWTWLAGPGPDAFTVSPNCLAVFRGEVYAAGAQDVWTPATNLNLARWTGREWMPVGPGLIGSVTSLAVFNDELIVAGRFSVANDPSIHTLARWDGTQWRSLGADMPQFGNPPSPTLLVHNGRLVVSCFIVRASSAYPFRSLSAWDGESWSQFGDGFVAQYADIESFRGELVIGGFFSSTPVPQAYLARWSETGTPWIAQQPKSTAAVEGRDVSMAATIASGYSEGSVRWTRNGVEVNDGPEGASIGGGSVEGARSSRLQIRGLRPGDAGLYEAWFGGPCGTARSEPASISVLAQCPADLNDDRVVDDADFTIFAIAYVLSDCHAIAMPDGCPADLDMDNQVGESDFALFLEPYNRTLCD